MGKNIPTMQELSSFVRTNRASKIKQKISIISDSATDYQKILNAIDMMTETKINNYKLVFADGTLPTSPPIVVQSTRPFTKDIDPNDSTVLIIAISGDSFATSLLNKKEVQKTAS